MKRDREFTAKLLDEAEVEPVIGAAAYANVDVVEDGRVPESEAKEAEDTFKERARWLATPFRVESQPGPPSCAKAWRKASLPLTESVAVQDFDLLDKFESAGEIVVTGAPNNQMDLVRDFIKACATHTMGVDLVKGDDWTLIPQQAPDLGDESVAYLSTQRNSIMEEMTYQAVVYVSMEGRVMAVDVSKAIATLKGDPKAPGQVAAAAAKLAVAAYKKLKT